MQQVSIETAQSNLDCAVLEKLLGKTIILGTLDLSDMTIERLKLLPPYPPRAAICAGAADCGRARLRVEISAARHRLSKDLRYGRGRRDRAARTLRELNAVICCRIHYAPGLDRCLVVHFR
jgi:hypothetical protein